jgi:hypothetical protein
MAATTLVSHATHPATPPPSDALADVVIVDAIAVSRRGQTAVLALGEAKSCACALVVESFDGGADWQVATVGVPVPARALLDVAPTYPDDPRIFIVSPGAASANLTAASFGRPFVAGMRAPASGASARARPCALSQGAIVCDGHRVDRAKAGQVSPGQLLGIGRGHLIYFGGSGGILCSSVGASNWRESCGSIT